MLPNLSPSGSLSENASLYLTTSPRPSISSRFYTHHVWLFSDGGMFSISTRSCTGRSH